MFISLPHFLSVVNMMKYLLKNLSKIFSSIMPYCSEKNLHIARNLLSTWFFFKTEEFIWAEMPLLPKLWPISRAQRGHMRSPGILRMSLETKFFQALPNGQCPCSNTSEQGTALHFAIHCFLHKAFNAVIWFGEYFIGWENLLSVGSILPLCVFATYNGESVISLYILSVLENLLSDLNEKYFLHLSR